VSLGVIEEIRSSLSSSNICLAEISSLKKKGFVRRLSKGIRKAIAEVQLCGVASLAEIKEGLPSQMGLLDRNRLNHDFSSAEKHIALPTGSRTQLAFDHERKLNKIGGAHAATVSVMNHLNIPVAVWFSEEDRA
jgi:hypothetical protein